MIADANNSTDVPLAVLAKTAWMNPPDWSPNMTTFRIAVLSLAALGAAATVEAQQNPDRNAPRPVVRNLDNPTGIAIHPKTGHVFVADRSGVIRLVRAPREEGQQRRRGFERTQEITGFPSDIYGKGPMYDIGPLGLAFLDEGHLIVADGSRKDVDELILVYDIEETPPKEPAQADSAEYTLGPLGPNEMGQAEGNYYAAVVAGGAIFATANGDDTKGWIVKSEIKDGHPGELKRGIATKEAVNVDAPVALTVNKDGNLVVGQMGEINVAGDSLLSIYDPTTGELKHNWETGLNDITGLAYSPTTSKLYATDFAWMNTAEGGLFELTIKDDKVETRKVASLDKPTAIAFDQRGNAYITVLGTKAEGSEDKPGQVIRIGNGGL
jgi:DNA-binding beta-propeller fold protein YncE